MKLKHSSHQMVFYFSTLFKHIISALWPDSFVAGICQKPLIMSIVLKICGQVSPIAKKRILVENLLSGE